MSEQRKLIWGDNQYVKCSWCNRPAVAVFANRTDGRNGPVCDEHFCENTLLTVEPRDWNAWLTTPVVYLDRAATKEEKADD